MEFKSTNIPSKKEVEIAAKIVEDFGREKLISIGCKNFKPLNDSDNDTYGVEFNLPTNKSKGNRCSILKFNCSEENSNLYSLFINSKYFDKINNRMVSTNKGKIEKSNFENVVKEFYNITCL